MSNQENDRLMSFILEQQAKLTVKLEQMAAQAEERNREFVAHQRRFDEEIRQINEAHAKAEPRISELEGAMVAGINLVNNLNKTMAELAEAHKRHEAEWAEWRKRSDAERNAYNKRMDEYGARQKETNARLDAFITVLERYISENRNGKRSRKPEDN